MAFRLLGSLEGGREDDKTNIQLFLSSHMQLITNK
jgi:hypothetical protein